MSQEGRAFWIVAGLVGGMSFASQQVPGDYVLQQRYGPSYLYNLPTNKMGNAWTLRPWVGRTGPFANARAQLEGRLARPGFDAQTEFARLEKEAKARPADALAQFSWATLAFLAASRDGDRGVAYWSSPGKRQARAHIRWALALAPDPANAEYDRLRFIFEAAAGRADSFRELGKRLILKWPHDDALLRNQAENLAVPEHTDDVDKAIAIADSLLKRHPRELRYLAFKGDIYRSAWISLRRRADGLADVEWTERYLRVAPPGAYNREALRRANEAMRAELGLGANGG